MLLTMATTHPRTNTLLTHVSQWHTHKRETTFLKRLGMRSLEVIGVAIAMFTLPWLMHRIVRDMDEVYELLGRRARSPYKPVSWVSVIFAMCLMLGAHICLGRLSYHAVLEDNNTTTTNNNASNPPPGHPKRTTYPRLLSRILIPLLLLTLGVAFTYSVFHRIFVSPNPLVTKNSVDMQEAMAQLYGVI